MEGAASFRGPSAVYRAAVQASCPAFLGVSVVRPACSLPMRRQTYGAQGFAVLAGRRSCAKAASGKRPEEAGVTHKS